MTDMKVPVRFKVYDMSDGCKQIHIIINGRVNGVLHFDPATGTLGEIDLPQDMHKETGPLYRRNGPVIDNTNRLGESYETQEINFTKKETK